jgi:hypothetical protein
MVSAGAFAANLAREPGHFCREPGYILANRGTGKWLDNLKMADHELGHATSADVRIRQRCPSPPPALAGLAPSAPLGSGQTQLCTPPARLRAVLEASVCRVGARLHGRAENLPGDSEDREQEDGLGYQPLRGCGSQPHGKPLLFLPYRKRGRPPASQVAASTIGRLAVGRSGFLAIRQAGCPANRTTRWPLDLATAGAAGGLAVPHFGPTARSRCRPE